MDSLWMIRTSSNQLHGPMNKGQLLQWIESGRLHPQDEISSGSKDGYWFFLFEKEEVKKWLNIDSPFTPGKLPQARDEETTQPNLIITSTNIEAPHMQKGTTIASTHSILNSNSSIKKTLSQTPPMESAPKQSAFHVSRLVFISGLFISIITVILYVLLRHPFWNLTH